MEVEKTCFDCENSTIIEGNEWGGREEPPTPSEAHCNHEKAYLSQDDDLILGDKDCQSCPYFKEKKVECIVCGVKFLISDKWETPYGGSCCSKSCFERECKNEIGFIP